MHKLKILLIIIIGLSFSKCEEKELTAGFPKDLKLSGTISSGCLNHNKSIKYEKYGKVEYTPGENYIEVSAYIYTHCGAEMTFEMDVLDNYKIVLKEVDKATRFANCLCGFTFSAKIENVIPGITYEIKVWNKDRSVLIDSKTITL